MQMLRESLNHMVLQQRTMCAHDSKPHMVPLLDGGAIRHQLTTVAEQSGAVAHITKSMVM